MVDGFLKEPLKWASVMNVPPPYRAAVLEYLQFFTEFMRVTENVPVQFQTRAEGNLLCVEFLVRTELEKRLIQQRFDQYKADTGKAASSLKISFNNSRASDLEKEITEIRYRDQLNRFKFELEMVQKLLSTTQEVNQLLRERAGVWSRNPPALLAPVLSTAESECETPIFFLTADLADYSTAARADRKVPSLTLRFLSDQENRIEKVSGCERVKLEGDCIKVFGRDGKKLVQIARSLVHAFEDFALEQELDLRGIRVVLGHGVCTRLEKGGEVDFAGPPIDETVRVDQPMKDHIQAHDEDPNQIWCTEAFEQAMRGRNKAIEFEALPAMTLPKGQPSFSVFRVTFR
jgi:hypothetical protein